MPRLFRRVALVSALLCLAVAAISQIRLPDVDDGRPWRERLPTKTRLDMASRAAALNQNEIAERFSSTIIRTAPRSSEAAEAHKLLSRIYLRTGRYKSAIRNLTAWLKTFPNSKDAHVEQRDLDNFRNLPDQTNSRRRAADLKHAGDLWVPLSVNGKGVAFLFDTGAWVSVVTQTVAERIGLEFRGGGVLGDSSGKGAVAKTAVAKELVLGNMRFKDVSFFVVPDEEPFTLLPVEQRGIIGVPIQFAVGTWQWFRSGTLRVGEQLPPRQPNLVFFKNKLLVSAQIAGRDAFLTLDSGATTTDLNSNFLAAYPDLAKDAQRTSSEVTGLGGTSTFEARILPELAMTVAGHVLLLRPAEATIQTLPGIGGDCCVGNFGSDLLMQGDAFTIDFDRMSLSFPSLAR